MTDYKSKHGTVSKAAYELYMAFCDLSNVVKLLPEDKKAMVQADYDHLDFMVQGFNIGVRVAQRTPYSRLELVDNDAPFHFSITIHFDAYAGDPYKTDFYIELSADLNFMMKTLVGGKIKDALDKVVDAMVAASEGRMPEGMDESMFPEGLKPNKFPS